MRTSDLRRRLSWTVQNCKTFVKVQRVCLKSATGRSTRAGKTENYRFRSSFAGNFLATVRRSNPNHKRWCLMGDRRRRTAAVIPFTPRSRQSGVSESALHVQPSGGTGTPEKGASSAPLFLFIKLDRAGLSKGSGWGFESLRADLSTCC